MDMNQVIPLRLENKISRVKTIDSFPQYSRFHAPIPDYISSAVEFIGDYYCIAENEVYGFVIQESSDFFMQVNLEDNINNFANNFKINWIKYPYEISKVKKERILVEIENPFIYNLVYSQLRIPKKQIFNYFFASYIQLFLNEYNSTPDENFSIIIPSKQTAISNARKNKNFTMLRALNEFEKIYSFTRHGVVITQDLN